MTHGAWKGPFHGLAWVSVPPRSGAIRSGCGQFGLEGHGTGPCELGGVAVEALRILEIEAEVRHDVIGLLTNVAEALGGRAALNL